MPAKTDVAEMLRKATASAPTPPPRKTPLQELALMVPTKVRRELTETAAAAVRFVHGMVDAGASPAEVADEVERLIVLHILETGIKAYIQSVHHLMAATEQDLGVEEAFTAEEQEHILQKPLWGRSLIENLPEGTDEALNVIERRLVAVREKHTSKK